MVEVFPLENDMAGIRANLHRMARFWIASPRPARLSPASTLIWPLCAPPRNGRRAAIYGASGYSAGENSLAGANLSEAEARSLPDSDCVCGKP